MDAVATQTRVARSRVKQLRDFCLVALLIFSGVYTKGSIVAAALLALVLMLFNDLEYGLELLFFLLPMASVFKMAAGQASLFSYLLLFFVIKAACTKRTYSGTIVGILLMASYLLIGGSLASPTRCKDILLCLFACYFVMTGDIKPDLQNVLFIFSAGVIVSAMAAIIADSTPIFSGLVRTVSLMDVNGEDMTRFRALYGNSNYYTLDISLLCASYMSVFCKKKTLSKEQWATLGLLLFFGVLSGSFSFMISTLFAMFLALLYLSRQNLGMMLRTTAVFAVVITAVFFLVGGDTKELISYRVEKQFLHSEDLGTMTSERSELQSIYLEYFKENTKTALLGEGLAAPNIGTMGRGPHNTYIDVIYYFGALGGLIYVGALISFMRRKVRFTALKVYQWIPLATLLVRLMAISLLLMSNMTFYYLLVWLSFTFAGNQEARENAVPGF